MTLQTAIALVPFSLASVALCQAADLYTHQLILARAASAAARAAAVVLPDDGVRYGDPDNRTVHRYTGQRKQAVEAAAQAVLNASDSFDRTSVAVAGRFEAGATLTAELSSEYRCLLASVPLVCGYAGTRRITARARLAYQFAPYRYIH